MVYFRCYILNIRQSFRCFHAKNAQLCSVTLHTTDNLHKVMRCGKVRRSQRRKCKLFWYIRTCICENPTYKLDEYDINTTEYC